MLYTIHDLIGIFYRRKGLACIDLNNNPSTILKKVTRNSKWECGAIEWNPHLSHAHMLASSVSTTNSIWLPSVLTHLVICFLLTNIYEILCINKGGPEPRGVGVGVGVSLTPKITYEECLDSAPKTVFLEIISSSSTPPLPSSSTPLPTKTKLNNSNWSHYRVVWSIFNIK